MKKVDARGLSCPQPVILASRAIAEGYDSFTVIVDNEVARENILRLTKNKGLKAEIRKEGNDTVILVEK
ncbi:MAG: SirA family protein [Deltaproteobacteria bacterium]|nr:SirA family protein [Deltaproteobacteria bacterium]